MFKYKVERIDIEEENQKVWIFLEAQEEGCAPKIAVEATIEEYESDPPQVGDEVEINFNKKN
jgi:hypothetical protein